MFVSAVCPGNNHDQNPPDDPFDTEGIVGKTCSLDMDCGETGRCVKGGNQIEGACLLRWPP